MTDSLMLPEFLKFEEEIYASDMDERCKKDSVNCIAELIRQFESQPEIRAADRVRRAVREEVKRTLTHLTTAARNVGEGKPPRREARKLIRGSTTFKHFEELSQRASSYRGRHNTLMSRHNDLERRAQARKVTIDNNLVIHEIKTRSHLKSVGKKLRNCLGSRSSYHLAAYASELRTGKREFWELKRGERTIGVMSIDPKRGEICEFRGYDNESTGCSRSTLLKLLEKLEVTGDRVREFIDNGVIEYFLHQGEDQYQEAKVDGVKFKVWGRPGEVILHSDPNCWTLLSFKRRHRIRRRGKTDSRYFGEFELSGKLGYTELLEMLLVSPELSELVSQYRIDSSSLSYRLDEREGRLPF